MFKNLISHYFQVMLILLIWESHLAKHFTILSLRNLITFCIYIYTIPGRSQVVLSSVQLLSHVWFFVTPWAAADHFFFCPSLTPVACSNSGPSNRWCHSTISSFVIPFSSCLQSFPASGSFPMSQFCTSDGQSIGIQLQHQSFQWIFSAYILYNWLVWSPCSSKDS